jgi:ATP-binding cassette subfamily F protein 3
MIRMTNVSKAFGAQQVLSNVNLHIGTGERVGIVGPNGSGKSTIFSLLIGDDTPDSGTVSLPRDSRIGHLAQQLHPDRSDDTILEYAESGLHELADLQRQIDHIVRQLSDDTENSCRKDQLLEQLGTLQTRFEDMDGYSVRNRAETALSGLGFLPQDFSRPFKAFSGGWQMRAQLVQALIADPDILLLDEPSNYLDIPAIEWLQRFLRAFSGTLVLISHDRYLLNTLTSVTIEMGNAQATRYSGNCDFYLADRVERHEQQVAACKNQQRKREQIERFIERFRSKNTKAAAVQSRIKMLERMEDIQLPQQLKSKGVIRLPDPIRTGQEVARLEAVGITYDKERWVLQDVDMRIERGDKIALVGLNGLGKTTLLRVLAGQLAPSTGRRVIGHKVTPGYQSQEFTETMDHRLSVLDTVRNISAGASDSDVRTLLGGFGFSGDDVKKKVIVLSGGEKVRLAFARMLINPPNFLLLDEPTTHLDIAARQALETALCEFSGTLCIVSHDIQFVRKVANTVIAMTPPGITKYHGGYDYYLQKVESSSIPAIEDRQKKSTSSSKRTRQARAKIVQSYSKVRRDLQKEIQRLEKRLESHETEQARLLEVMKEDGADYEELNKGLITVQQKINDCTFRWEAFAVELEELDKEYSARRNSPSAPDPGT